MCQATARQATFQFTAQHRTCLILLLLLLLRHISKARQLVRPVGAAAACSLHSLSHHQAAEAGQPLPPTTCQAQRRLPLRQLCGSRQPLQRRAARLLLLLLLIASRRLARRGLRQLHRLLLLLPAGGLLLLPLLGLLQPAGGGLQLCRPGVDFLGHMHAHLPAVPQHIPHPVLHRRHSVAGEADAAAGLEARCCPPQRVPPRNVQLLEGGLLEGDRGLSSSSGSISIRGRAGLLASSSSRRAGFGRQQQVGASYRGLAPNQPHRHYIHAHLQQLRLQEAAAAQQFAARHSHQPQVCIKQQLLRCRTPLHGQLERLGRATGSLAPQGCAATVAARGRCIQLLLRRPPRLHQLAQPGLLLSCQQLAGATALRMAAGER